MEHGRSKSMRKGVFRNGPIKTFRYNPIKTSNPFDYISPEGKSLVERLIQLDPDSRLSAIEVLHCGWLNEFDYEDVTHVIPSFIFNSCAFFLLDARTFFWQFITMTRVLEI